MSWETQLSADYVENFGKVRVGKKTYEFHQQYSSQDKEDYAELIFKVALANLEANLEYKLDFYSKVRTF